MRICSVQSPVIVHVGSLQLRAGRGTSEGEAGVCEAGMLEGRTGKGTMMLEILSQAIVGTTDLRDGGG